MKNFSRIFKYIHIPKDKFALYLFYTILATIFSLLSIGLLSPFMNLIFNTDPQRSTIESNSIGPLKQYFQTLIDQHGKLFGLSIVCLVIVIATLFKNLFLYLSYYTSAPVRSQILSGFRILLYDKTLKLPLGYFSEQKKGDIMSRYLGDIGEINSSVIMALEGLIKDPLTIISFLIYMVYLSPQLSLLLLVLLPLTALIIGKVSKKLKRQSKTYSEITGQNLAHIEETLGGMKVIKAFNAEKRMMNKFRYSNDKLFALLNHITLRRDLASPLTEVLGVTVLCVILY